MKRPAPSSDRLCDKYVATLLLDALREVTVAFARSNKTAALLTVAAIERDLIARVEAFADLIASPPVTPATTERIVARISTAMDDVQRAAEDVSIQ